MGTSRQENHKLPPQLTLILDFWRDNLVLHEPKYSWCEFYRSCNYFSFSAPSSLELAPFFSFDLYLKSMRSVWHFQLLQDRDSYWKMMQKYIGSDVTSMVTLPVMIFEPMTMLQKMAEVCAMILQMVLYMACILVYMLIVRYTYLLLYNNSI